MVRTLSLALAAGATVALSALVLPAGSATRADDAPGAWVATHPARVMTYNRLEGPRPKPSATPTATPTASPSPAPTAVCAYPTSSFNGAAYCPGTIVGVRGTVYGIGARVVLKGVTVTKVTTSAVTVAVWASPPCPPGRFCGQLLTLESLVVPWTATSRPGPGDVLDLFGRTITGTITPAGYVKTGFCPIDFC